MILMKKSDLYAFANGQKDASCRPIGWNQAKEDSTHQLRLNFNLPVFAWVDVESKQDVELKSQDDAFFKSLGHASYDDYMKEDYNANNPSDDRTYLKFGNLILNPDFPWDKHGIDFNDAIYQTESILHMLDKYVPKIGKPVNDDIFGKKAKLTGTAIINKISEWYFVPLLKEAYDLQDADEIADLLCLLLSCFEEIGFRPDSDWLNPYVLPFSLGNDKIGKDTLCISINSSLLCYMRLMGRCENCKICYGVASNRMYTAEYLKHTIANLHFIEGDAEIITMETVKTIRRKLTESQLDGIKFIRFNVNGDILNNGQLIKLDYIAGILKKELGIKIAYTYTHNKHLDLRFAKNIVINASFKDSRFKKHCLTAFQLTQSMMDDPSYIVCNGDCNRCPYCKNPNERRTVIFLAHGGGKKGIKQIPSHIMDEMTRQKEIDYLKFIKEMGI